LSFSHSSHTLSQGIHVIPGNTELIALIIKTQRLAHSTLATLLYYTTMEEQYEVLARSFWSWSSRQRV